METEESVANCCSDTISDENKYESDNDIDLCGATSSHDDNENGAAVDLNAIEICDSDVDSQEKNSDDLIVVTQTTPVVDSVENGQENELLDNDECENDACSDEQNELEKSTKEEIGE